MIPAGARQAMPRAFDALDALRRAPAGTRLLWAVSRSARVPGVDRARAARRRRMAARRGPARRFCVTDANVGPRWAATLGELDGEVAVEPGER